MKIRNTLALAAILTLAVLLFAACSETDAQSNDDETATLAGFIEIRDDTLYITPVEVFMLYSPGDGQVSLHDTALGAITFIGQNDSQKLTDFGLTLEDFLSWAHIRPNWHNERHWHYVEQANIEVLSFEITAETEFVFINSDRQHITTNAADEFLPYLYPTVVHFIEVRDGRVVRLVQEFGFTM